MTTLRHRGAWGTYTQRGRVPSRGETVRPKRLAATLARWEVAPGIVWDLGGTWPHPTPTGRPGARIW